TPATRYPRWHLFTDMVKVEDVFAAAKRAGATTAAIYWPVTGCNPNVDYLLNEYFFYDPSETLEEGFARQGSSPEMLAIARKNAHLIPNDRENSNGQLRRKDEFDDFLMACTCDVIRTYQPDLMLVHNSWPDSLRHQHRAVCMREWRHHKGDCGE
ncbi:MAG: hypothetical protein IJ952_04965, partial [Alistipes sp.]|nr:hypothetical protein [Alistipes sp.]